MALTNNGTKCTIPEAQLPSGYTRPTVTSFTDYEYTMVNRVFTVAKSGVENATGSTTLTALVAAVNTQITNLITAEYDVVTYDVDVYSNIASIRQNLNSDEVLWTDGTNNYLCTTTVYIKTAAA